MFISHPVLLSMEDKKAEVMLKEITSVHNPEIRMLRGLERAKERRESGLFLIEGVKMTAEAVSAGLCRILLIESDRQNDYTGLLRTAEERGARCVSVSRSVLQAVCTAATPQSVCCAAAIPAEREPDGPLLVALDGIQDPGNLGTILRTADAAGFSGALLGAGCADPYGSKAIRATMGSIFRIPMLQTCDLPGMLTRYRERHYWILSSELGGTSFYRGCPDGPAVLLIGSEGRGVSPESAAEATHRLALPMRGGAESLNAAVAAGIMMYEMARRAKGE